MYRIIWALFFTRGVFMHSKDAIIDMEVESENDVPSVEPNTTTDVNTISINSPGEIINAMNSFLKDAQAFVAKYQNLLKVSPGAIPETIDTASKEALNDSIELRFHI